MEEFQNKAVLWHKERFPNAQMSFVALKTCEEAGEVARAVNGLQGNLCATGGGSVPEEAADVVITLLVLLGRWFPNHDLLHEVQSKLNILTDPSSNHPASLQPIINNYSITKQ